MFEQFKGFFGSENKQEKSDREKTIENIKSNYRLKIAMLIASLLSAGGAVHAQESADAQFKNKVDEPTLSFEGGATPGPEIKPEFFEAGGSIRVNLGRDYTINVIKKDEQGNLKTLRSDDFKKGSHSLSYDKDVLYKVIDTETGQVFPANVLFPDDTLKSLKKQSLNSIEEQKLEQLENLSKQVQAIDSQVSQENK